MIGHCNHNIQNHVKSICTINDNTNEAIQKLKKDIEDSNKQLCLLEDQISVIKKELAEYKSLYVTFDDITELVNDIKESFNLFVLATPRPDIDPKILERIQELEDKMKQPAARTKGG